jgi:hypothetical protein
MESFTQVLVQGLVQALVIAMVILAGVWAVLKRQFTGNNNTNGKCEKRLQSCNEKFLKASEERGGLRVDLKDINGHLHNIDEKLDNRLNNLEEKMIGHIKTIDRKLSRRK